MDTDLGNQPASVECPHCGAAIEVVVNQVVAEETVVCPNCQAEVQLKDKRGAVSRAESEAAQALEKLQQAVEDSGTTA
jgi:transcription elongation factor Elf1